MTVREARPLRVLTWADWWLPSVGGVEVFSARLAPALAGRGVRIEAVVGRHADDVPEHDEVDGVPVHRFPFHQALASRDLEAIATTTRRVGELRARLRPDLVHLNTLGPGVLFERATRARGAAPVLLTLHSPVPSELGPDTLAGRALRSATRIACNSHAVHADLARALPEVAARSLVVHYGLPPMGREPPPRPRAPRLLAYGRLVDEKGFDVALRAFATVLARHSDARLALGGDGPARPALARLADELGIAHAVDVLGLLSADGVSAALDAAALVVVPSRWDEPFGLVALEAALRARPVVATRVGGLVEAVEDGVSGLLVEREDADALAAAILRLLEDAPLADRLGADGRARAETRFGWDACVTAYERLYTATAATEGGA
ncbi:MAG: glycosyltransferase family 4 protein [Thermoleophilia bacterium]